LGSREPTYRLVPENGGSSGQEAIKLMESAGVRLDDWQQDWLEAGMATLGRDWAADEVGLVVSRQNGKSLAALARALWGPTLGPERLVVWTSHQFKSAREIFLLAKSICETPAFERFEPKPAITNGREGITFKGGSRLLFLARSRVSGRGFSPDCVILDEAFELDDLALSALKPSLAAAKAPQMWFVSSAPHETSTVLRRLALRGRAGEVERLCYFEWVAPDELAPGDIKAWEAANPALGSRIDLGFVASELDSLKAEDFDRERLGRWAEGATGGPIDRAMWDALADPSPPAPTGTRVLAIDVAPDRRRACIAAAAEVGESRVLVEILAKDKGVAWVVDEVAALVATHKPDTVVLDSASQARSLIAPLAQAGVTVTTTDLGAMVEACGAFYDAVLEGWLVHRGDPVLDDSVEGVKQRTVGDGAWAWARRTSASNVTPLVAATLALWGTTQAAPVYWVL
jgi:phage terminase large subunit-like protein